MLFHKVALILVKDSPFSNRRDRGRLVLNVLSAARPRSVWINSRRAVLRVESRPATGFVELLHFVFLGDCRIRNYPGSVSLDLKPYGKLEW